jgi:hypothetical protein
MEKSPLWIFKRFLPAMGALLANIPLKRTSSGQVFWLPFPAIRSASQRHVTAGYRAQIRSGRSGKFCYNMACTSLYILLFTLAAFTLAAGVKGFRRIGIFFLNP